MYPIKTYIHSILIYFGVCCNLNSQTEIIDHEKYNSYEQCIYVDNLDQKLIPEVFNTEYYYKIKEKDFKIESQLVDTIHKKRIIYFRSKKSKDGYLFVNKSIMEYINNLNYDLNQFNISYLYNGKAILTKDQVNQFFKLRRRYIKNLSIFPNEKMKIITVLISDN